jgi:hypothetical protein
MTIKELELAVSKLSYEDLTNFAQWFEEFMAEQWDKQIETDILAGRLNSAGKRADEAFESGRATPL